MRSRVWGLVLAAIGLVCLVVAAILAWVVVPQQKQLPADTNTTRQLTGTAKVLLVPAALVTGDLRSALQTNVEVGAGRDRPGVSGGCGDPGLGRGAQSEAVACRHQHHSSAHRHRKGAAGSGRTF